MCDKHRKNPKQENLNRTYENGNDFIVGLKWTEKKYWGYWIK